MRRSNRLDYGRSPHAYVNQRLQIQLELLMMSGVPLETCWAFNERWNNKFCYKVASCWLFLLKFTISYQMPSHTKRTWSFGHKLFVHNQQANYSIARSHLLEMLLPPGVPCSNVYHILPHVIPYETNLISLTINNIQHNLSILITPLPTPNIYSLKIIYGR
jgi:hypothetical protein